jgi:hypothetical protein
MLALDGRCLSDGIAVSGRLVMSLETRAVGIAYCSRLMVAGDLFPPRNLKDPHAIKSSSKRRGTLSLKKVPHNAR